MKDGINSRIMKIENALLILETIMRKAPISRSELNQMLGLTQVSVINVTNALLEAGILVKVGSKNPGSHGRKSVVLDVKKDAFYSIGVELSVGKLVCGLADAKGTLLKFQEFPYAATATPRQFVEKLEAIVADFQKECGISKSDVIGLGIAAPGPLDVQNGILINPPNFPEWNNVPIQRMLEDKIGIPVCLDMETNLAALVEHFYGVSEQYKTTFFLSLAHQWVGGGLLSEQNIFHGFRDSAGEIGHMIVKPGGRKCNCGNYGCLETMIAEEYILEQVRHLYERDKETNVTENLEALTLKEVFARSEQGDSVCRSVVRQMADYIALALGNMVAIFSPEFIVLGGPLTELSEELVELVAERLHQRPYPRHCREIQVERSALGSKVYVKGATALVLRNFLANALPEGF